MTLGSGGGVVEAARARVRYAWAKFNELSPILTVRGASYRVKGNFGKDRTYDGVRWMCGVSLKDRRHSEDLCNFLGINCVADMVRRGRLR